MQQFRCEEMDMQNNLTDPDIFRPLAAAMVAASRYELVATNALPFIETCWLGNVAQLIGPHTKRQGRGFSGPSVSGRVRGRFNSSVVSALPLLPDPNRVPENFSARARMQLNPWFESVSASGKHRRFAGDEALL
jgi:hypothetical protein